jgi:RNA polymerase sigma-70 factor (ECF subfamily)
LDSVSPVLADLKTGAIPSETGSQNPELHFQQICGLSIDELWQVSESALVGLGKAELARVLLAIGIKYNYGMASGVSASQTQIAAFLRSLQLPDLALAHACALGRDAAWERFMALYREPLTQAAIAITGSAGIGHELADSLYSEMFGLTEREGQRRSPLAYYSGRGSLKGFLRASLAQRHVDGHRRTGRETSFPPGELAAAPASPATAPDVMERLKDSLAATLQRLDTEERFVLSAWFLDRRSLLEISRTLRVHEATVSRRIGRLTDRLHAELLANLQASGMSRAAALEALGTDPRDININLRSLLQSSSSGAFPEQSAAVAPRQI